MKQALKKEKVLGKLAFDSYYSALFPNWQLLKSSLLTEPEYVQVFFADKTPYFMDIASVCAALCLPVKKALNVLDMCAAPGGKSLVLSLNMPEDAQLLANERSADRKKRLDKVLLESLSENRFRKTQLLCSDAATLCNRLKSEFDAILLDAPCSSERHVLKDEKYLNLWSPSRIKRLSIEQWALISSAWRLLKNQGFLVYSTCALNSEENDKIILKLCKKFSNAHLVEKEEVKSIFIENLDSASSNIDLQGQYASLLEVFESCIKTQVGFHILPCSTSSVEHAPGPIYFSVIQKQEQP